MDKFFYIITIPFKIVITFLLMLSLILFWIPAGYYDWYDIKSEVLDSIWVDSWK
jgi:hypothetical protein